MNSVSIVTICWNAAATIQRTLESVLAQSLPPLEYLVVDGGSTDGTLNILDDFASRFSAAGISFQILYQSAHPGEEGIPHAWNMAIRQCKGDVIALLNADDWYVHDALKIVSAAFEAHPTAEAVSATVALLSQTGEVVRTLTPRSMKLLPWLMPIPHPGCFFRSSVYDHLGLYDTHYRISADYDFIWRCWKKHIEFLCIAETTTCMQTGGVANSNRAIARKETLNIARRYSCSCDLRPLLAYLLRCLTGR